MIYFGEWMNVSVVRGGALLLPYSSFLALMQEKKQKKIKVPGAPAKLAGYMIDGLEALAKLTGYMIGEVQICAMYQANFPASAEAAGQVFIFSGRGVLHTPHRTTSHGWRMRKPYQLS